MLTNRMLTHLPYDMLCLVFEIYVTTNKQRISLAKFAEKEDTKKEFKSITKSFLVSNKQLSKALKFVIRQEALIVLSRHLTVFYAPLKDRLDYAIARLNRFIRTHNMEVDGRTYKDAIIFFQEEDIVTIMLHADALFTFRKTLTTNRIDILMLFAIIYLDILDLNEHTLDALVDSLWAMRISKLEKPEIVKWSLLYMQFVHLMIDKPDGWSSSYTMLRAENKYLKFSSSHPLTHWNFERACDFGTAITIDDVLEFTQTYNVFCETTSMRQQGFVGLWTIKGVPCNRCFNLSQGTIVDWEPDVWESTVCGFQYTKF